MNTITQIYKNIIKNRLKEKINSLTNNMINTIIDSIGKDNSSDYVSIVSSVQDAEREMIKQTLITTFEELDNNYKYSKERFKFYVVNKSNIPRTITTLFGDITFLRTYYKSRLDDSLHFLLDEMLELPKYDRYDPIVKAYAVDIYTKTNQKLSGEITGNQISSINNLINKNKLNAIPRQSIHNWINNWNEPNDVYSQRKTPNNLYIMIDEKFLGCQDKENDIMVKSYVVFENIKPIYKNRNALVNRLVFNTSSDTPWIDFTDFLYKIYDATKIKNIYILSDGGKWITSNIDELRMENNMTIKHLLCEFHFKQSINRITTVDEERKTIFNLFQTLTKKEFFKTLNAFKEKYSHKAETIEKQITYISNYYKSIKDMLKSNIGSSMESHISHIVASPFSSRPKGFSSLKINKYLKINDYVNNGINIFKLYLDSFNNPLIINTNTPHNVNITTKDTTHLDSVSLPIIESGHMTQTFQNFKTITSI